MTQTWAELENRFRQGRLPEPHPDGRFSGHFLAFRFLPGLSRLAEALAAVWRPWRGKVFYAERDAGYNLLNSRAYPLARLLWPFYNHYSRESADLYRAFPFRTYPAPGRGQPAQQVLCLDYNLKLNPRLNVRRIRDELVEIEPGVYLGKAYLRWFWGAWQQWAFFQLQESKNDNEP